MSLTPESNLVELRDEIASHKRKAIIHYHLHKTGGTTVKRAFQENFEDSAIEVNSLADVGAFEKRVKEGLFDEEKTYFIYGHRSKNVADLVEATLPTFGFTIMRRPFSMFESNYSFQHTRHGRVELTSQDYLKEYPVNNTLHYYEFPNLLTGLELANHKFHYTGITENMEESFAILKYLFDLEDREYLSRNVTRDSDYVQVDTDIVMQFVAKHLDDVMFYEHMLAKHTMKYREFKRAELGEAKSLKAGKGSFHKPVQVELDIDQNNDKVSLFLSGREIYRKDTDGALAFFTKSFEKDWNMADRIVTFIKNKDEALAKGWIKARIAYLEESDVDTNKNMIKRMEAMLS